MICVILKFGTQEKLDIIKETEEYEMDVEVNLRLERSNYIWQL